MLQQDEKGQLWLVEVSNLQGQGGVKVQRIPVQQCPVSRENLKLHAMAQRLGDMLAPPNEMQVLTKEQADDLEA